MSTSANSLRAGNAAIELSLLRDKFESQFKSLESRMRSVGDKFAQIGKVGAAVAGSITTAFASTVKMFASVGDNLDKMSLRTGFSVETLSALNFAAGQSGASLEAVEKAAKGMARSLLGADRGSKEASDNLTALGLTVDQLRGMRPEDQFTLIADRLSKIPDTTTRAALAMKLFGKSGSELLPLLEDGAGGITALINEAHKLGIVMSTEDATAAAQLNDAFGRLQAQFKAVLVQIGAALSGELLGLAGKIKEIGLSTIVWVKNNRAMILAIAEFAAKAAIASSALYILGKAITAVSVAVGAMRVAITLLTAHPLVALAALLGAVTIALLRWSGALDGIISQFAALSPRIASAMQDINGMTDAINAQAQATENLTLEQKIAAKEHELRKYAAHPKTFAKLKAELEELKKTKAIYDEVKRKNSPDFQAEQNAKFRIEAGIAFNNILSKLPVAIQAKIAGAQLPPEVSNVLQALGESLANLSNAVAGSQNLLLPELNTAGLLDRVRTSPVAAFDTRLARQMFGGFGGGEQVQKQQLDTQKKMLLELRSKRGGIPVI